MIGVFSKRGCWWISAAVSNPSMSGIETSSRITANSSSIRSRSASIPELALTMFWPRSSRIASYERRREGWSSTRRLLTRSLIGSPSSSVQPHAQEGEELLGVHGLRDVVGRARLEALVAVALHRLRGERDDRQEAEARVLADPAHRLVAVH